MTGEQLLREALLIGAIEHVYERPATNDEALLREAGEALASAAMDAHILICNHRRGHRPFSSCKLPQCVQRRAIITELEERME